MSTEKQSQHGIRFARHRPTGKMISAAEATKGLDCDCVCVACQSRLVARKGEIRIAHFAHHQDSDCPNAAEAAIHWMAKQIIAEKGAICVPHRSISKKIYGERRVWEELISVDVQKEGLTEIQDCKVEVNVIGVALGNQCRRPDLVAKLNGTLLAIEICNTNPVDEKKREWLEKNGFSVLEIGVSDLASLPSDQYKKALERRLFSETHESKWLVHLGDSQAKQNLAVLEHEMRLRYKPEEDRLLSELEEYETALRNEAASRQILRDVEEFKIRFDECTIRLGRNNSRATLKAHGYASRFILSQLSILAKHHGGRFNVKVRRWEFYRSGETKQLFDKLRPLVIGLMNQNLSAVLKTSAASKIHSVPRKSLPSAVAPSLPQLFDNTDLQELFDERAGMLEYNSGLSRTEAEKQAFDYVINFLDRGSDQPHGMSSRTV